LQYNPFRLINEEDVLKILAYVARVEDRLKSLLSDTRNSIVPSSLSWILTGCDINKDIQIDDNMVQLYSTTLVRRPKQIFFDIEIESSCSIIVRYYLLNA